MMDKRTNYILIEGDCLAAHVMSAATSRTLDDSLFSAKLSPYILFFDVIDGTKGRTETYPHCHKRTSDERASNSCAYK